MQDSLCVVLNASYGPNATFTFPEARFAFDL
jgi:hypothetical protein